MLKLGVITDEISHDLEQALKVMKEIGAEYAELRGVWGKNIMRQSDEEIREVRRLLMKYGVPVSVLATPFLKIKVDSIDDYREHLKYFENVIRIAKFLDTDKVRVFSFWRRPNRSMWLDRVVEALGEFSDIARNEGILLVLENESSCMVATGAETLEMISRAGVHNLKVIWDPGNAYVAGETPYPDGYLAVKNHVVHMHVKDCALINGKKQWVAIGSGMIDYVAQFKALIKDGYSGVVSLETHYKINGDREAATRESFAGLLKTLRKALDEV